MRFFATLAVILASAGCQMSPVPRRIAQFHERARHEVPVLERFVQPGDIVFRLSSTELAGGLVDFSATIAKCTESQMSHATLVYHVGPEGAIVVDITPAGIQRRYLIDWHVDGTTNIVLCRLKPEYQFLIPKVLDELDRLVAQDVMYDVKFDPNNDRYYCTEVVDHCFRVLGYPLAPLIRIRDFPKYDLLLNAGCLIGGINPKNLVAVVGNEHFGLFSSPMLEIIVDFRGRSADEIERLLPRTQLAEGQPRRAAASPDEILPVPGGSDTDTDYEHPVRGPDVHPSRVTKTAG